MTAHHNTELGVMIGDEVQAPGGGGLHAGVHGALDAHRGQEIGQWVHGKSLRRRRNNKPGRRIIVVSRAGTYRSTCVARPGIRDANTQSRSSVVRGGSMDFGLKGKKAVITGGTRGIGRAIADSFAAAGVDVAICARHAEPVREATAALRAMGINAIGSALDVADGVALKSWIAQAGASLGGIDILIANPSAFGIGSSEDDWRNGFEVDLMGTVRAVEAASPFLEKAAAAKGDAAIVILSSAAVAEADYESAYGAMKAALIHFSKGVGAPARAERRAYERHLAGDNLCAGRILGQCTTTHAGALRNVLKRNPMGRMGCPKEIAKVAAFLASPLASFTTGANIVVDGAFTSRVQY